MLVKRTNILFDEDLWGQLTSLASSQTTSVGNLVRNAVKKVYFNDSLVRERAEAIDDIMAIRKVFKGKIDYKELINAGRKY